MATAAASPPADQAVSPPSRLLAFSELHRALFEVATLPLAAPLLYTAPRGDGHPVMLLPGFMATDRSMRIMRRYLRRMGHDVHKWELGRNLGPRATGIDGELLFARVREIHEATGQKVSLVGWSLGGALSRHLSVHAPDLVRQVITLGSPLRGNGRATSVWRVYEAATGEKISNERVRRQMGEISGVPEVPTTAIYTKADGVVPWQNCRVAESRHSENVEVYGSHCGLGVNGPVLYAIAERLAQKEGEWAPFERPRGVARALFPSGR
ncbi:MAG: alpha/beta hydrolase [Sphingomonadaceae bacterium]|nr:alpha/beta hydrolase [Sphingomonadaceae bacterium]